MYCKQNGIINQNIAIGDILCLSQVGIRNGKSVHQIENSHIRRTLSYCQLNDDWKFTLLQNYTNRKTFRNETVTTAINVNLLDKLYVLRFCLFVNILTSLWFDVEPHITTFERM